MSSRRGFLKLLGVAPVAAPAAATNAAASMGLVEAVGSTSVVIGQGGVGGYGPPTMDNEGWIKRAWAAVASGERRRDETMSAKESTLVLDSDVAALRSVSPAFKRMVQVDRLVERRVAEHRRRLIEEMRAIGLPIP